MNLSPEERAVGADNFNSALSVTRRDMMKTMVAGGVVTGAGLGAMYFDYTRVADPVRVGVIGTGDEGSVLIGAINPEYVQVVAIADIRPYNVHRAFHGDWASDAAIAARPGLMAKYGWTSQSEAEKHVKVYSDDYHELLEDPNVEAVIIALPLHLHAEAAIHAMQAGKHVLCEKLMAHNVAQCKAMARVAEEQDVYLSVGHQRHYSVLYDNAVNLIKWGALGEIHHIRAQWHRGNLPGRDSWQQPLPGGEPGIVDGKRQHVDPIAEKVAALKAAVGKERDPQRASLYEKQLAQWIAWDSDKSIKPEDYGYLEMTLEGGRTRTAMEELARWRLFERTGGGLMAELGSHQLDAASIFVSALRNDGKKVHPLTVHAVGGRHIFPRDRDAGDHVYCMFEFPGPGYDPSFDVGYHDPVNNVPDPQKGIPAYADNPNKKIVVTYSSIMGNGYGGYGEIVMGTKGTLILEREQDVMLFGDSTSSRVNVKDDGGGPTLDTQASGDGPALAEAANTGPVSRGYTEEIEHWAWCIRNKSPENQPRCKPETALGDAVIALTANVAIANSEKGKSGFIQFDEAWYDVHSDATPDGSSVEEEYSRLTKKA